MWSGEILSPKKQAILNRESQKLLDFEIIVPSNSEISNHCHF